jgi:hypothetical protein
MTVTDFLLPVFVEVGLIFVLLGLIRRGEVKMADVALNNTAYDARARQYANCFSNQFELPLLFFALIAFILITRIGDLLLLILAWLFVVSRIAHAMVHTTSNDLRLRFTAYAFGVAVLFTMWLLFALKILLGI